ncbi:uncharacterized protein LOC144576666 isoform X2 [Callithrix jacchus]
MSWDKGERGESIVKRKFITFLRNILLSLQQSDFWPVEKKTVNYYYWMDTDAFKRVLISIFCHGEYPIKLEVKQVKVATIFKTHSRQSEGTRMAGGE